MRYLAPGYINLAISCNTTAVVAKLQSFPIVARNVPLRQECGSNMAHTLNCHSCTSPKKSRNLSLANSGSASSSPIKCVHAPLENKDLDIAGLCWLAFCLAPRQSTCCWMTKVPILCSLTLEWKKNKQKNFYGRSAVSPTCFVFVSHMLPFLWQMELSKEVKDDAVQLCGSGVMRPGASAAWQQEPGDTTGPQMWPAGRSEKLPADTQPRVLWKRRA